MLDRMARTNRWDCPNPNCSWFRVWNVDQKHADYVIMHPAWGEVRSIEAARADIRHHNCASHLALMRRLGRVA